MTRKDQSKNILSIDDKSIDNLKCRFDELKRLKGIVSRKIGEAKKASKPFLHYIDQVKDISSEIADIQSRIKRFESVEDDSKDDLTQTTHANKLPSQFKKRQYIESNESLMVAICDNMSEWDDYVMSHPNSTIYHTSAIRSVIESSFSNKCHYLAAYGNNNVILGVLPLVELKSRLFGHFFVSLPYFNYGGALASTLGAENILISYAADYTHNFSVQHIEYRDCFPRSDMPCRSDKITMLLNLPADLDSYWCSIGSKLRAQIKKPINYGAESRVGREDLLKDFYHVFSTNMRDLGTPVYSIELFRNMLIKNQTSNIVVIYIDNRPVSAGFIIGWRDCIEIPWASTLKSANKYSVNMLLYWEVLKFSIQNGYKIFDFGRSTINSNTYKFKKQWGAEPFPLYWHYWIKDNGSLPSINPDNPRFKLMIYLWKKLPVSLANYIGPKIVKNIP